MDFDFHCIVKLLWIATTAAITVPLHAQGTKLPVLSSRDKIDGPFAGASRIEELHVFADGRVEYVEQTVRSAGSEAMKSVYKDRIVSNDLQQLLKLLDSSEIRSLAQNVPPSINPVDLFWQKSLSIDRKGRVQQINIANFYPFVNMHRRVYASALIELECTLQQIKSTVTKRPKEDWCEALVGINGAAENPGAECHDDPTRPSIVAGEGWGAVRVGAPARVVERVLGKGQSGYQYKDVYFKRYPRGGVEISFENGSDTVHAIFFYNRQRGEERIGSFCSQTANSIGWHSSVEEVKEAYGQPIAEFSGTDWGGTWIRLVFTGIDFRFENGKMVRIGIPGN